MPIIIGPLDSSDDRAAFSCEEPALTDWFRTRAGQEQKRNIAQVFVARDNELGVVGYYSLSAFSIETSDLPDELGRKLPRYDAIPAVLIGRLARDSRVKGRGVGELLIAAALRQIVETTDRLGIYAVVVDAKHEKAAAFYREYGFQPFPTRPLRLFMPIATARKALEQAGI
ncbi:MAG: GNAT family N-acetyltransferase [Steroidobacteraceae bacterium]